jgi:tetratricopeptide (TPR) repeat protein
MSGSSDFTKLVPAALQIVNLPVARDVVAALPEPIQSEIRRELPQKPLLELLTFLLSLAQTPDTGVRAGLMLLGKIAIARHSYTSGLYDKLLRALFSPGESPESLLSFVLPLDANLATEILSIMSRLAADSNALDPATRSLELGVDLARRERLPLALPLLLYRLANLYVSELKKPESADELLAEVAELTHGKEPELENSASLIRAALIARGTRKWEFPPPLQSFLDEHPDTALSVAIGQAKEAVSQNNLPLHEQWCLQAHQIRSSNPKLLVELNRLDSILARRKGDWELADLRFRQHAALLEDTGGETDLWDRFYLERDLGDTETARMLLNQIARRTGESDSVQLLYHRGLLAFNEDRDEEAARLFHECLAKSPDINKRASCHGMLGMIPASRNEMVQHLFEAHRLFNRAGATVDTMIVLTHMALLEITQGKILLSEQWPLFGVSPFSRAARLLERAQAAAEKIGDDDFLIDIRTKLAFVYQTSKNYRAALDCLEKSMERAEWVYLRLTQPEMATRFAEGAGGIVSSAIDCAVEAERPDLAVSIAERLKARRLLRDLAEIDASDVPENQGVEERALLERIRPLRRKLVVGRPLTTGDREELDKAQSRLRQMRENTGEGRQPAIAAGEPLSSAMLRSAVFGVTAVEEPIADTKEDILPGVGMQCACGVFNRTESTFCSGCDAALPKSARISLDGDPKILRAQYGNYQVAEAADLLRGGDAQKALALIEEARQLRRNPVDSWLTGLVRIVQGEFDLALQEWGAVKQLQFSFEDPYWPLPLSPSAFEDLVESCRREPVRSTELAAAWIKVPGKQGAQSP